MSTLHTLAALSSEQFHNLPQAQRQAQLTACAQELRSLAGDRATSPPSADRLRQVARDVTRRAASQEFSAAFAQIRMACAQLPRHSPLG